VNENHPSVPARDDESTARGISRRHFLKRSTGLAGAAAVAAVPVAQAADGVPAWMQTPGKPLSTGGAPSRFEAKTGRIVTAGYGAIAPGTGSSRTPLHLLEGTITPSAFHFERHHNGVPDIDPAQHQLLIHGLVQRPLAFSLEALARYPMVSRTCFVECSGNSSGNTQPKPPQANVAVIHGLLSVSEWTGVPLGLLLDEAGVTPGGDWLLAEGADAAAMSRSVPLTKAYEDAIVALYQNGERIRPEQGYPMRLLLPGWEGNMNVKWLRRLKVTQGPTHTKDETSKYSDPLPDGRAEQFTFLQEVKSVITRPAGADRLPGAGWYEITGLAWSGRGRIRRVEVSTDGGATWREATLQGPVLAKSATRFRLGWQWDGQRTVLQSRATDEHGHVQPTRAVWQARYAPTMRYHNNMIQSWEVAANGSVSNVYL